MAPESWPGLLLLLVFENMNKSNAARINKLEKNKKSVEYS